jgi:Lipase (class 3).
VKTIRKIIENFPSYGIIDVFSLHPTKDVVASVIALSRLQRITLESVQVREDMASKNRYLLSQGASSSGAMERDRKKHFEQDDYELLADLAHYATLAHCAYGWKFGLLSGRLHLGDKAMLQRKTGVQKSHIICAQWKSKTHLPAHFLVRDLQRKTIVLCIRGTLSPKDILTDLCCTADEFLTHEEDILEESESIPRDVIRNIIRPKHKAKAHHGMLQAAKNVAKVTRKVISTELASNPEFNLIIVGHSLGGGVAAVLGSLWRDTFPGVKVYAFGCPCVGPADFHPYQSDAITCVVGEGDPFSCLSLGHLADASLVLSKLCQDSELRNAILNKTKKGVGKLDPQEIAWCVETMKALETDMQSEKFYPPGRVLYMRGNFFGSIDEIMLREVNQETVFRHLRFHPRMFDLSLHVPHRYEILLARIWNDVNEEK